MYLLHPLAPQHKLLVCFLHPLAPQHKSFMCRLQPLTPKKNCSRFVYVPVVSPCQKMHVTVAAPCPGIQNVNVRVPVGATGPKQKLFMGPVATSFLRIQIVRLRLASLCPRTLTVHVPVPVPCLEQNVLMFVCLLHPLRQNTKNLLFMCRFQPSDPKHKVLIMCLLHPFAPKQTLLM